MVDMTYVGDAMTREVLTVGPGHSLRDVAKVLATPTWTLTEAADAMRRGGFRHLIVLDGGEVVGVISVRDLVRAWAPQPA